MHEHQQYWIMRQGKTSGPFEGQQVLSMARSGLIEREDMVSANGVSWRQAEKVKGLFGSGDDLPEVIVLDDRYAPLGHASDNAAKTITKASGVAGSANRPSTVPPARRASGAEAPQSQGWGPRHTAMMCIIVGVFMTGLLLYGFVFHKIFARPSAPVLEANSEHDHGRTSQTPGIGGEPAPTGNAGLRPVPDLGSQGSGVTPDGQGTGPTVTATLAYWRELQRMIGADNQQQTVVDNESAIAGALMRASRIRALPRAGVDPDLLDFGASYACWYEDMATICKRSRDPAYRLSAQAQEDGKAVVMFGVVEGPLRIGVLSAKLKTRYGVEFSVPPGR